MSSLAKLESNARIRIYRNRADLFVYHWINPHLLKCGLTKCVNLLKEERLYCCTCWDLLAKPVILMVQVSVSLMSRAFGRMLNYILKN